MVAIILFVLVAVATVSFQAFVSWKVVRFADYSLGQKLGQLVLVWILALFGALVCYFVLHSDALAEKPRDETFLSDPYGSGDGQTAPTSSMDAGGNGH